MVLGLGIFLLVAFMLGFPLPLTLAFSLWKVLEFHLKGSMYRGALLWVLLWFSTYIFLTVHLHTPF